MPSNGSSARIKHAVGTSSRSETMLKHANRMDFERFPLIVTDGFDFYEKVVRRVFGPAALYGQVLKTRRNDRIVKLERRELLGASWRFEEVLNNSEDSLDIEHLVHRAAESDHPPKLGIPFGAHALPRTLDGEA